MFRKITVKSLAIIFGVLLLILVVGQWLKKSGDERNFRESLVEVDTAAVTSITIIPKGKKEPLVLKKTGTVWNLIYKNKSYKSDKTSVTSILQGLTGLKAERLVASGKEYWDQYEVTDATGTSVKVEENGSPIAEFILGKISYRQDYQNVTTFARLKEEDDVYALAGFLPMNFNQDINTLRFKEMGTGTPDKIHRVTFSYPADSAFTLSQAGNQWNVNGMPVDSTSVYNFLQTLTSAAGNSFADDNTPLKQPIFSILAEAEGKNLFEIKAFPADSANMFYVTSSVNPGAIFSESRETMGRIFISQNQLRKK